MSSPVMPILILSLTHQFRSPSTYNLYPLPTLFTTFFKSFQKFSHSSMSPSLGLYIMTTYTLTLENLNLTQRVLELTHVKSITALCHTSFIKTTWSPQPLSISWITYHLPHTMKLTNSLFTLSQSRQATQTFPFWNSFLPSLHFTYPNDSHNFAKLHTAEVGDTFCPDWG